MSGGKNKNSVQSLLCDSVQRSSDPILVKRTKPVSPSTPLVEPMLLCQHVQTDIQCLHTFWGKQCTNGLFKVFPTYYTEIGIASIFNTKQHIGLEKKNQKTVYCIWWKPHSWKKRNWQKCYFFRKREFIHSYYCYFLFWKNCLVQLQTSPPLSLKE